ncbi:hypothetical protein KEM48_001455 [Puccinia striiformis f. sp. tritici PST-130]|nr:hypothetical protein KEM48_001455 [Puccinia striiformis f. sp. tritici PST-130]
MAMSTRWQTSPHQSPTNQTSPHQSQWQDLQVAARSVGAHALQLNQRTLVQRNLKNAVSRDEEPIEHLSMIPTMNHKPPRLRALLLLKECRSRPVGGYPLPDGRSSVPPTTNPRFTTKQARSTQIWHHLVFLLYPPPSPSSSSSATSSRPTNCSTPAKMASNRERPPHRSSCASSALGNQTDDDEPEPNTKANPSTPNSTQPSGATQALTDHEELCESQSTSVSFVCWHLCLTILSFFLCSKSTENCLQRCQRLLPGV